MSYPSMIKIAPGEYVSEEQRDGVPDYTITAQGGGVWLTKGRTSGMVTKHYSAREALDDLKAMYE